MARLESGYFENSLETFSFFYYDSNDFEMSMKMQYADLYDDYVILEIFILCWGYCIVEMMIYVHILITVVWNTLDFVLMKYLGCVGWFLDDDMR